MAVSKANQRAVAKYIKNNYDDVKLRVYKGQRDIMQTTAKRRGMSVNNYIRQLIRADIERNGGNVAAWDALTPSGNTEVCDEQEDNT